MKKEALLNVWDFAMNDAQTATDEVLFVQEIFNHKGDVCHACD